MNIRLGALILCLLLIALACSGGGGGGSVVGDAETVEMKLQVDLNQLNTGGQEKLKASESDVTQVKGELSSKEGFLMEDIIFTKNEADLWISDSLKLPSSEMLTLNVFAYDSSDEMLFAGELDFLASEDVNLIVPVQAVDEKENTPPLIRRVLIPSQIEPGESIELVADVHDENGDVLSYLWTPNSGDVIGVSTGNVLTWSAPEVEGTSVINFLVFDGVDQTSLDINLEVGYGGSGQLSLVFMPVLTGFEATWNQEGDLNILATVSFDESRTLTYHWKNDLGETLSLTEQVDLAMSDEIRANGLMLELSYDDINSKTSYRYPIEDQLAPVLEYVE